MKKKTFLTIIKNIVTCLISIVMFVPLILILINSLKDKYESSSMGISLPRSIHFENFITVINQGKLIGSFLNSMIYSVVSIILGIIVTTMAAYVLSRHKTRLNKFIYFFMVLGLAMPINFISLMKVMQYTHLINTRLGLCLLYAAIKIPFSVFVIYGFIGTIPRDIDEAGIIDGSGPLRLFFKIIMPLLKPVIVTVGILNFLDAWNEFVLPLYFLNSASKWPMTLAVYNFFGQFASSWNLVCADIVLTSLPVIIIYLIGQKYIVAGMTSGAVKG
jgi:raffinose/stachyose/melibiose transport system permease protein